MENFYHALIHTVEDVLLMLPILFLAYLLVSYLSHDHNHKFSGFLSKKKKTSVLFASFLGCVPQCGFSTVIADLYSKQKVTLGTLIAVFIATSDEAIPIMITSPDTILDMLLLIAIKIVLAIVWGYGIDFVVSVFSKILSKRKQEKLKKQDDKTKLADMENIEKAIMDKPHHHHHEHECGHIHTEECGSDCHHDSKCCVDNIFLDAFKHMFEIAIYIFVATFVINLLIEFFTLDAIQAVLTNNIGIYLQIIIASLVGLIPNCASSVLLVELYTVGLSFPALVAGLSTGAGVGLFILISRNKKHPLQSLGIVVLQFAIGVISGLFLTLFF